MIVNHFRQQHHAYVGLTRLNEAKAPFTRLNPIVYLDGCIGEFWSTGRPALFNQGEPIANLRVVEFRKKLRGMN